MSDGKYRIAWDTSHGQYAVYSGRVQVNAFDRYDQALRWCGNDVVVDLTEEESEHAR